MVWRRPGDKPLSEPMMDSSLTHVCVTRPQWVNSNNSAQIKARISSSICTCIWIAQSIELFLDKFALVSGDPDRNCNVYILPLIIKGNTTQKMAYVPAILDPFYWLIFVRLLSFHLGVFISNYFNSDPFNRFAPPCNNPSLPEQKLKPIILKFLTSVREYVGITQINIYGSDEVV